MFSNDCIIENNLCLNNDIGIEIEESTQCTITNNTCSNNGGGILLNDYSDYCTIENNTCSSNSNYGLYLKRLSECTIKSNTFSNNDYGIILTYFSSDCLFENNIITKNNVGILLMDSSQDNSAHYNNIFNNVKYGIQAVNNNYRINATNNYWGAANGPYHATKNSDGDGDNITDDVDFEPWLEEKRPMSPVAFIESISSNPAIEGETIRFEGSDMNDDQILLYTWRSNIDGEFFNDTEKVCTYDSLSVGTHTIYFKIQNESKVWSDEVTASLIVTNQPVAEIVSISPNIALDTETIHFQGAGTDEDGSITTYAWRSNIYGEFYNGSSEEFSYSDLPLGVHNIFLKVQDNYGIWSESVEDSITIHERPVATIVSISPNPALNTDTISFNGEGTDDGTIERYVWRMNETELYNGSGTDFSDSSFISGSYSIFLKVQDNYGVWSEDVNTTLIINERPNAIIDLISPNPGFITDEIHFSGNGTDDGTIERYVWRTDDVELYDGPDPEFSYFPFNPGSYNIYLKVADNYGIWSEEVDTILTIYEQPTALIDLVLPNPGIVNEPIIFRANGTDDGTIERYVWRTGEGEFYNNTIPQFSYSAFLAGTYSIYLKVQDNHGIWSDEVNVTLIIHERPVAEIVSISPSPATEGNTITFVGNGSDDGSIVRYTWRSDELELYNDTITSFTLSTLPVGTHIIYLSVQDNFGVWSDEVSEILIIHERPTGTIDTISPNPALHTDTIQFSALGQDDGTVVRYAWRTEESEISNGTDAGFSYSDLTPGIYTIYLKVQDNYGVWSEEVSHELVILADTDDDGIPDKDDAFPTDPAASVDTDGDGYPEEWNVGKSKTDSTTGLKLDEYPDDPNKWKKEESGGGGFLPGFELVILSVSIFISITISRKK